MPIAQCGQRRARGSIHVLVGEFLAAKTHQRIIEGVIKADAP
jgi:hypothetical protein